MNGNDKGSAVDTERPGNRVEIMRADPRVYFEGKKVEVLQQELFRLLVLHGDEVVWNSRSAEVLGIGVDSVKSRVRDLRKQFDEVGCRNLIETRTGVGYKANLTGWDVDIQMFEAGLKGLNGSMDLIRQILKQPPSYEDARLQQNRIEALRRLWKANPAEGLGIDDGRVAYYAKLKQRADEHLLLAKLCSGIHEEVREAATELDIRLNHEPANAYTWILLLHAHHSLSDKNGMVRIFDRILKQYGKNIPSPILEAQKRIGKGGPLFPIVYGDQFSGLAAKEAGSSSAAALEDVCKTLGISTPSYLKLADSELTPEACIRRTKNRLLFSGVLASKWVTDAAVRSDFNRLLTHLDKSNGEVKFMVINPDSDAFQRLTMIRQGAISTESLVPLRRLANAHDCFEVRMFNALPAFRIIVIDNDVVGFSPYRLSAEAYETTRRGWQAPHVVLDPQAPYPLAEAFELLFRETWNAATPLE